MDLNFKHWMENILSPQDNVNSPSCAAKGLNSQLVGGVVKPEKEFNPDKLFKKGKYNDKSKSRNHI